MPLQVGDPTCRGAIDPHNTRGEGGRESCRGWRGGGGGVN